MPLAIQELRPESLAQAIAFARARGSGVDAGRIVPALSLVAVEADEVVATAVCVAQKGGRHRIEIGLIDPARADLHRALVDKALMKLASAGVRKFDIHANGEVAQPDFWQAVSWIDQALNPPTQAATPPAAASNDAATPPPAAGAAVDEAA